MKFLLDTNVFLWGLSEEYKLNLTAQEILTSSTSELYFSAVGSWEIAIKFALGSLPLPKAPSEYIPHTRLGHGRCAHWISHTNTLCARANCQHIIVTHLTGCSSPRHSPKK